jgi:hypothetical protein
MRDPLGLFNPLGPPEDRPDLFPIPDLKEEKQPQIWSMDDYRYPVFYYRGVAMRGVLSLSELQARANLGRFVMWHPLGQVEWLKDPFALLLVDEFSQPKEGRGTVVTLRTRSREFISFRRQIDDYGLHHRDQVPQFCDYRLVSAQEFLRYYDDLQMQLATRLELIDMAEEKRLGEIERIVAAWVTSEACRRALAQTGDGPKQAPVKEKVKEMKEMRMGVLESLKAELVASGKRGGKVALSCAAADVVTKQVRKLLGKNYPKFFTQSKVGRAMEPIAMCCLVLLIGYAVQIHGGTKLPLHDTVMNGARYALEGKIRDGIGEFVGPATNLFASLGAELGKVLPQE